jgi:hypothetical protein
MPALLPVTPTPTATVQFRSGPVRTVIGPANSAGNAEYPWRVSQTLVAPRVEAAAVRFCSESPGGQFCQVDLVRPGLPVTVLKNGNVTRLFWSADVQLLIGAGITTVRLWTLSGTLRTAVPFSPLIEPGDAQTSSQITRLWLSRGDLCVATRDQLFDTQGQQRRTTVTTTRYRLPTLQGLTSHTLPGPREADCQAVRRSD